MQDRLNHWKALEEAAATAYGEADELTLFYRGKRQLCEALIAAGVSA